MALRVVLDTCVLYPISLCDILLRLAERELYDAYWSGRIIDELRRNLVEHGMMQARVRSRVEKMRMAFPEAEVPAARIARLEPRMTNEPKDRHVLAAAVVLKADAVVTFNLRDFAGEAREPYGIEALHPDQFLVYLHEVDRDLVEAEITAQAAALRRPPVSRQELIRMLERGGVPHFAARLRAASRHAS
jgi:predicted nucleic acid-binding protein